MKEMTFNEAAKICQSFHQPITISVDGKSKVFLMSEEIFDEYFQAKRVQEVLDGLEEIEQGKGLNGEKVFAELEEIYGF